MSTRGSKTSAKFTRRLSKGCHTLSRSNLAMLRNCFILDEASKVQGVEFGIWASGFGLFRLEVGILKGGDRTYRACNSGADAAMLVSTMRTTVVTTSKMTATATFKISACMSPSSPPTLPSILHEFSTTSLTLALKLRP